MSATLANSNDQINIHRHQSILLDAQLFSAPDVNDETDLDGTTVVGNAVKPVKISTPGRPWSDLSMSTSTNRNKKSKSRSYKFIELERNLISTNLLKTNDDRIKFEIEYLNSIRENTFDDFLQNYYQKIYDHYQNIKKEQEIKKARIFTFFDLEKNFLTLDPTRDVKILFIDDPTASTITNINTRSTVSAHQTSTSTVTTNDAAIESFYANRSHRLINNRSRARDEITLFARRTAERLHEYLPRLTTIPHRVKIIDERDTTGKPDERTLLQLKHKRALSLINQRRNVIIKMMTQNKKNQIKMEQQWNGIPLATDKSACCRELLERANQVEQVYREEKIRQRPQTSMLLRKLPNKNISSSSASSQITTTDTNITPSFSSCSTPFKDALSIHDIEKTKNVRIIRPTRPLTAPTKVKWVNYC